MTNNMYNINTYSLYLKKLNWDLWEVLVCYSDTFCPMINLVWELMLLDYGKTLKPQTHVRVVCYPSHGRVRLCEAWYVHCAPMCPFKFDACCAKR